MTAQITLAPVEGGIRYCALVRHKLRESRFKHEEMGLHKGWKIRLDPLVALVSAV